jgi:hypothetical protein
MKGKVACQDTRYLGGRWQNWVHILYNVFMNKDKDTEECSGGWGEEMPR